ncbi:hypothetical protein BJX99DRAFT_249898 [Aspergillus californicus]
MYYHPVRAMDDPGLKDPSSRPMQHNKPYPAVSPSRPELSASGKIVIITGAGSSIGRATALSFARAGASKVVLVGRTTSKLEETQSLLPCDSTIYTANVQDEKAMGEIAASVGTWHILVLAAAYISPPASIQTSSVEEWWMNLETNLKGTVVAAKSLLPMVNPTRAVVIGYSAAITFPAVMTPGISAYAISKLAIVKLIEFIAAEYPSVFTAALHPGFVETEMSRKAEWILRLCLLMMLPGHFAVWLASQDAAFLNGRYVWANWDVDELKEKAAEIQSGQLLTAGIQGWPFGAA